jgi:RecB family exonuclease
MGELARLRYLHERDLLGREVRSIGQQWRELGLRGSDAAVRAQLAEAVRSGPWAALASDPPALDLLAEHLGSAEPAMLSGPARQLLDALEQAGVRTVEAERRQLAACSRLPDQSVLWPGPDMDGALALLAQRSDCDVLAVETSEAQAARNAGGARFIVADDVAEAICSILDGRTTEPSRITIACPDSLLRRQLAAHLASAGWLTLDRRRIHAHELALASALASLAGFTSAQQLRELVQMHSACGLTDSCIDDLMPTRGAERLRVLAQLGAQLIERAPDPDAASWVEALARRAEQAAPSSGPELEATVLAVAAPARLHGHAGGIALASMQEAASLDSDVLIICSMEAGTYPPAAHAGPFGLQASKDWQGIARALTASAPELAFVRSSASAPSSIWSRWGHGREQTSSAAASPRARLRSAAQRGILSGALLEKVLTRSEPRHLPDGHFGGDRTSYDVTELEQMLRCPYGWFVRYALRPRGGPESKAATLGQLVHAVLASAMAKPQAERPAELERLWNAQAGSLLGDVHARAYLRRMQTVIERYGGADWAWDEHQMEVSMEGQLLVAMPDITIRGRLDRLDTGDPGPLVIDYKNRRGVKRPSLEQQPTELQSVLYPLLAERSLGHPAAGMLYVSIFHGAHAGISRAALPGIDNTHVAPIFEAAAVRALDRAAEAIERIRAGQVDQIGDACPAWCPHRLISDTAGRR